MEKKSLKIVLFFFTLHSGIYLLLNLVAERVGKGKMTKHECKFRCTILEKYKMTHMELNYSYVFHQTIFGIVVRIINFYFIYTLAQKDKNITIYQHKMKKVVATKCASELFH